MGFFGPCQEGTTIGFRSCSNRLLDAGMRKFCAVFDDTRLLYLLLRGPLAKLP